MEKIIDIHIHVGHRFEWTDKAKALWMDTGPYVPRLFDHEGRQMPEPYGDVVKDEGVMGGILIPEYSPGTAGVMPFERAVEIHSIHPELIPIANLNPHYQEDLSLAFDGQLAAGARGLKIHSVHGMFFANDRRLYPVYERCAQEGLPVLFHAGTSVFPGAKMRYADPFTFDDIINDFPDLKVVLCHGGRGFWYEIAEYLARTFKNVFIDVSGLPPQNLLQYFPKLKRFPEKFLFGSDFPGVPGIRSNYEAINRLINDPDSMRLIGFQNAYDLFGFWKEGVFEIRDAADILPVVNDGAKQYRGIIPSDRYHEPYMSMDELRREMKRMRFYGYKKDGTLKGVIGKEKIKDQTLIRHLYVVNECQGQGIGSKLVSFVERSVDTSSLLVGTWQAAVRAITFYEKQGFQLMENKDELLRKYWNIADRQIETSCVLGKRLPC
jgi:predicted TIM-barrel fold metal-dependent hydrolase/N-acetylglutamate synthase-like GNAT family acetyltransferase